MKRALISALLLLPAVLTGGCARFDRDPLAVYQSDPIDFDFPTLAVVYF